MVAAIAAARSGTHVTILERNPRIGKKILATGNGRCNYTNVNTSVAAYFGHHPTFVGPALSSFNVDETLAFFDDLGVVAKVEEGGKVFPLSEQASSVLDVLMFELYGLGVEILTEAFVKSIKWRKGLFQLQLEDGRIYQGDRLILATGGKAMPSSGSDGYGYELAQSLGHRVTPLFPALVQLKLEGDYFKQIEGVKFPGTVELVHQGKSVAQDKGDILFGNYGVSGPPILQISRKAGQLLQDQEEPILKLSIIDTLDQETLRALLFKRFTTHPDKTIEFSLVGLVNKRLIPVLLKEAAIPNSKALVSQLSRKAQERLLTLLQDWRFPVTGSKGWTSTQVTAGGVRTEEIDPNTMESNIQKGLYFCGEVIDIDGLCGGFNLQWAWSSGYLAGKSAALS